MLSVMIKSKLPQFLGKGKKGRKKGKGKKGPKLGLNWRVKAMYGSDKAFDSVRHFELHTHYQSFQNLCKNSNGSFLSEHAVTERGNIFHPFF